MLQVDVVETPLSMLIGSAIGIDSGICSPPEFHNKYATRLQDECASVSVCASVRVSKNSRHIADCRLGL